jgi:hypothetical protein
MASKEKSTVGKAKTPGRPTTYTEKLSAEICRRLATGRTLRDIARDSDMPPESTVRTWANNDVVGFHALYARAREIGYQAMADEIIAIADDGDNDWIERQSRDGKERLVLNSEHLQRSKLRVDARKWLLSKALPKLYGDRLEHTAPEGSALVVNIVRYADDPPS